MATNQEKREVVNSTKGFSSSLFLHSMLILIGISPLATFNAPIWEEEQPGMEVALGFPDEGQGNDEPTPGNNEPGDSHLLQAILQPLKPALHCLLQHHLRQHRANMKLWSQMIMQKQWMWRQRMKQKDEKQNKNRLRQSNEERPNY